MSGNKKNTLVVSNENIVDTVQHAICSFMYRTIHTMMCSVNITSIIVKLNESYTMRIFTSSDNKKLLYFSYKKDNNTTWSGLDSLNVFLDSANMKDPFYQWVSYKTDFENKRAEFYNLWYKELKKVIILLETEEKKYNDILEDMQSLPMFTPTRSVIIEKC